MDALEEIREQANSDELLFTHLTNAAKTLEGRYRCLDTDFDDVEQRVSLLREAISLGGITDDRHKQALISLAEVYYLRGLHRWQSGDFSNTIDLLTDFFEVSVDGSFKHSNRVLLLAGSALRRRYFHLGDGQDLIQAFEFHSILASNDVKTSFLDVPALTEISHTFFEQGRFTSDIAVINSSLKLIRRAMNLGSDSIVYQHVPYMLQARISVIRCMYCDDLAITHEMVLLARKSLELAPYGHRDYYEASAALSTCLYNLAWQCGDNQALDECIAVCKVVLPNHGQPDGRAAELIVNGARALEMKYRQDGFIKDLNQAMLRLKSYCDTLPPGVKVKPEILTTLSNILLTQYYATGNAKSINEAADTQLTVLATTDPNNRRRSDWLSHLAACRFGQYKSSGDISTLQDAVAVAEQGFETHTGKKGMVWENHIAILIELMLELYLVDPRPHILERATALAQEWLLNRSKEEFNAGTYLTIIAVVFRVRYEELKMPDDLTTGISLLEECLKIFENKKDLEYMAIAFLEYGRMLHYRHETPDAVEEDAHEALVHRLEALKLLAFGHPRRAVCLMEIAQSELYVNSPLFSPQEGVAHLLEALSLSHTSAHTRLSDITRMLASLDRDISWIRQHMRTISFLKVYRRAIDLMPHVASLGLSTRARLRILVNSNDLITQGWTHAISEGDVKAAIEILEIGRGLFWAQGLRLRTKFDLLPPDLEMKLTSIAHALEMRMPDFSGDDQGRAATNREVNRRRELSEEFDQLLIAARSLPGFEDLLTAPGYRDLARAAEPFSLVVLVPGENLSHALIMVHEGAPHILELPRMTVKRAQELETHLSESSVAVRRSKLDHHASQRSMRVVNPAKSTEVDVYLELWQHVMLPVISYLGLKKQTGRYRPRLMLCPTGVFMRLPLHASGDHSTLNGSCVSDFAVPSYTPTISALLNARRDFVPATRDSANILLAAVPEPFTGALLPQVEKEELVIRSAVPEKALQAFSSTAVMHDVLRDLPSTSIVHLACHGIQDPHDALQSGFVMADGLLTISQLMELRLTNAFLAVLSACETAKGDLAQPDQAVHLAGTMLFAGFRSVVATMWSMGDLEGPIIAKSLYEGMFNGDRTDLNPDDIPYALDTAVNELRESGVHPSYWATYIHIGI